MDKLKVGVLGARGEVGQRFIEELVDHPYFEIKSLYGSERTVGMRYSKATGRSDFPKDISDMVLLGVGEDAGKEDDLLFSALPSSVAKELEGLVAKEKPVLIEISEFNQKKGEYDYSPEYGIKVEAESLSTDLLATKNTKTINTIIHKI